jgi:hypothetical protein
LNGIPDTILTTEMPQQFLPQYHDVGLCSLSDTGHVTAREVAKLPSAHVQPSLKTLHTRMGIRLDVQPSLKTLHTRMGIRLDLRQWTTFQTI